jgi:predicted ATP-grasp superfamily ATP-dependent carboligase
VGSAQSRSLAGGSRYAHTERRLTDALANPEGFVHDVRTWAKEAGATSIIPMTEAALLALLPVRETLPGILIPFSDADAFRAVSDKKLVLTTAEQVGISIPAQQVLYTKNDADTLSYESLRYPIVVKPSRSVAGSTVESRATTVTANDSTGNAQQSATSPVAPTGDSQRERIHFTVQHAHDAKSLRDILRTLDARAYPVLLQQRIVGPGIGIFVLLWNGELVASFAHRRIREHPPAGGVSVYRESIAMDEQLLARSCALLDKFCWQGVAMIEYKVDQATNTPYLMEINGRFWGSLQLAIDAGVNFPTLLLDAASNKRPAPVTTYDTTVRCRWFWGDVDHVVTRLRHSDQALALPPGAPSRLTMLKDFLRRHPGDRSEILRSDDPRPFFRETIRWFRQLVHA